jgi:MFS family permease
MQRGQKILSFGNITPSILAVGVTTFLVAISTAALYSISPFFLKSIGVSAAVIGGIQSSAEAIAQACKLLSGVISDYLKRNKPMFLLGTVLSAVAQPMFIFADKLWVAVASKVLDRLGNGLSGTPRDVYTAQHANKNDKGAAIGLIMTFKTLGCVLGPWIVMAASNYYSADVPYREMIAFLSFPCLLAVFVCWFGMKEEAPNKHDDTNARKTRGAGKATATKKATGAGKATATKKATLLACSAKSGRAQDELASTESKHFFDIKVISSLPKNFWLFIFIMGIFTFARAPEAYMLLGLNETGLPVWFCTGVIGFFNLASAIVSVPAGKLSDKIGRSTVLILSFSALFMSLLCFSVPSGILGILGVVFWGIQRSTSQILSVACIADIVPPHILGTAIGLLNLLASLVGIANALAYGLLQEKYNFYVVYGVAAACSFVALIAMFVWSKRMKSEE